MKSLVRWFEEVARGIQKAHDLGIVHRDIKPGNLLLDPDGRLKLTDFGLAYVEDSDLTRSRITMGTPSYMAPEQVEGRTARIGPWTDVYGLGATLYEALTLLPPYREDNLTATANAVVSKTLVPPRKIFPRIPRDLEAIVLKAMEKNPVRRYQRAGEFAEDLARFRRLEAVEARHPSPMRRALAWARRRRTVLLTGGFMMTLLLAILVGGLYVRGIRNAGRKEAQNLLNDAFKQVRTSMAGVLGKTRVQSMGRGDLLLRLPDLFLSFGSESENGIPSVLADLSDPEGEKGCFLDPGSRMEAKLLRAACLASSGAYEKAWNALNGPPPPPDGVSRSLRDSRRKLRSRLALLSGRLGEGRPGKP